MKRFVVSIAAALVAAAPSHAVSPTELGAFLAGRDLPPESLLAPLQQSDEYKEHARLYASQWFRYDDRYFAPMRAWAGSELAMRIGPSWQVTYLFGGPDLISALALFPEARSYALGGLEPVGKLTNPLQLTPEELHASLAALRKSTEVIMSFNHFITKDMKTDLKASAFEGVFPIMLVFLSFTDTRIDSAERLTLMPDGTLVPGEQEKGQAALRITFRSARPAVRSGLCAGGSLRRRAEKEQRGPRLAEHARSRHRLSQGGIVSSAFGEFFHRAEFSPLQLHGHFAGRRGNSFVRLPLRRMAGHLLRQLHKSVGNFCQARPTGAA